MRKGDEAEVPSKVDDLTEEDFHDPELRELLHRWTAPVLDRDLRAGLLRRLERARRPWWRRSIRVPVPLAAAAGLLLAVLMPTSLIGLTGPESKETEKPTTNQAPPSDRRPADAGQSRRASIDQLGNAAQVTGPLVTPTDLSRFKPVPEVKIRVISERKK